MQKNKHTLKMGVFFLYKVRHAEVIQIEMVCKVCHIKIKYNFSILSSSFNRKNIKKFLFYGIKCVIFDTLFRFM